MLIRNCGLLLVQLMLGRLGNKFLTAACVMRKGLCVGRDTNGINNNVSNPKAVIDESLVIE